MKTITEEQVLQTSEKNGKQMEQASTISLNTIRTTALWTLCVAGWLWIITAEFNIYQKHMVAANFILTLVLLFKNINDSIVNKKYS